MFEDLCWKEHDHAKSFVLRSYTMHGRFPVVSSSHGSKQLLCFMHGQGQKSEQNIQQRALDLSTVLRRNLKAKVSLWKGIKLLKYFPFKLRQRNSNATSKRCFGFIFQENSGDIRDYGMFSEGCSGRILNDIRVLPWKWPPQSPTPPPNSRVAGCPHWILRIWKCFPEKVENQG